MNFEKGITGKVPLRISFAGGGTDVEPFPTLYGGAVVSSTIRTYVYVDIWETDENFTEIQSIDTGKLYRSHDLRLNSIPQELLIACLSEIESDSKDHLSITCRSTVPPGSGLGASSAITVAILGGTKYLNSSSLNLDDLARSAYILERNKLGISGGYQDQYACTFGGFNLFEFNSGGNVIRTKIDVNEDFRHQLEHDILLFWLGTTRLSSSIIDEQTQNLVQGSIIESLKKQKQLAYEMRDCLIQSNLIRFAEILREGWALKKSYSGKISNKMIDDAYSDALDAGALGGKLLGAGGGGFLLLLVDHRKRHLVVDRMAEKGFAEYPLIFDDEGATFWKAM
jgi:D-glycero-alpha-D-manno-heptose-7-phosphate kinase